MRQEQRYCRVLSSADGDQSKKEENEGDHSKVLVGKTREIAEDLDVMSGITGGEGEQSGWVRRRKKNAAPSGRCMNLP